MSSWGLCGVMVLLAAAARPADVGSPEEAGVELRRKEVLAHVVPPVGNRNRSGAPLAWPAPGPLTVSGERTQLWPERGSIMVRPRGAPRLGIVPVFRLRTDNDAFLRESADRFQKECIMFRKAFARREFSRQPRGLSRRRFLQTAAGTAGAVAAGFLWPTPALAAGRDPKPLLGGLPNPYGGPFLHINYVGPADAPAPNGNDPSPITDFDGFIGSADIRGTGTGTNTDTGETLTLLFGADMRFMKGIYQRLDGRFAEATFAFVWLDLYQGQFDSTTEVHDFNPGFSPNGVLWTVMLEDDSVQIDFANGQAVMNGDIDVLDYTKETNALALGPAVPSAVTFEMTWRGPITRDLTVKDTANQFGGHFLENKAIIEWSATRAGFKFVSDPANTSTTVFAEIGRESNGIFF